MLLILTYHRIVKNMDSVRDFFDVSAGELEKHLRAAKKIWGDAASPAEVQEEKRECSHARTGFLVTFDDGTEDHYVTAASILERNEVRGVFFVSTSRLGTDGYLTLAQCRELQDRGHAIESHAHEHKPLVGLAEDELCSQLGESRRRLRDCGLGHWDWLAVPGGYFDGAVVTAARAAGYRSLRTIEWGYNWRLDPFRVESFIINRKTAGGWFRPLCYPHFEPAKKAVYRAKNIVKDRLPSAYSFLRHARQA
jgi:peptidoglycan/xylan/chitin deacetylase (PgdA/CDA1 family)